MNMLAVESSNVAQIGYEESLRLLRVVFRDGSIYDYPDVSPFGWESLTIAESKGAFIAEHFKHKGFRHRQVVEPSQPKPSQADAGLLQTFEPDPCCSKPLSKALPSLINQTTWECPKCGTPWKCRVEGPLRHWEPHPETEVIKLRG